MNTCAARSPRFESPFDRCRFFVVRLRPLSFGVTDFDKTSGFVATRLYHLYRTKFMAEWGTLMEERGRGLASGGISS